MELVRQVHTRLDQCGRPVNLHKKITSPEFIDVVHFLTVEVHGSLAFTGKGHGTDKAILMGLEGEHPETIDPDGIDARMEKISIDHQLCLNQKKNAGIQSATTFHIKPRYVTPRTFKWHEFQGIQCSQSATGP